jgi:hypothetical protein
MVGELADVGVAHGSSRPDCRRCGSSPAEIECVANIAILFVIAALRGVGFR